MPLFDAADPFHRRLARVALALVIFVILFCGYFPFDFIFYNVLHEIRWRFDWSLNQYYWAGDTVENLLFFMPLGFTLGLLFRRRWWNWLGNGFIVLLISCATSTAIETGQVFLWSRDPSITDVMNNSIGGLMGFAAYLLTGPHLLRGLDIVRKSRARSFVIPVLAAATLIAAALICFVPLELGKNASELKGWNPGYSMALGNEIGAARGWPGYVERAVVASRAADESQAEALLDKHQPAAQVFAADALQADYDLHGEGPFVDHAGKQAPLEFVLPATRPGEVVESPATNPAAAPVNVWEDHYLRSSKPVETLNRAIINSDEFSVLVVASTTRQDPVGEARVFTISGGANSRNLTLAQERQHLLIRLRTGTTGPNGDQPQFMVMNVFADDRTRTILVTFKNSLLSVYVDSAANHFTTRLTPEAATVWKMYPRSSGWSFFMGNDDVNKQSIFYRAICFFLLAILLTATLNTPTKLNRAVRIMLIALGLIATMAGLESLMFFVAKQPLHLRGMIAGVVTAIIGVLVVGVDERDEVIHAPQ